MQKTFLEFFSGKVLFCFVRIKSIDIFLLLLYNGLSCWLQRIEMEIYRDEKVVAAEPFGANATSVASIAAVLKIISSFTI